jgi:hypothetical protein
LSVVPAEAGTHWAASETLEAWVPASAGTTIFRQQQMRDFWTNDAKDRQRVDQAGQAKPEAEPLTRFFARAGLEEVEILRIKAAARDEGEV